MTRTRAAVAIGVCVLAALVGVIVALSVPAPLSAEQRVREVAGSLRCPTCVAESVADSQAPVAVAMRALIEEQVREGSSVGEVRSWFRDQYGESILLDPGGSGIGIAFWVVPLVLVVVAAVVVAGRRRWRVALLVGAAAGALIVVPLFLSAPATDIATDDAPVDTVRLLGAAAESRPGDVDLRTGLADALAEEGRMTEAVDEYAAAYRLAPLQRGVVLDYVGALVVSGCADEALPLLETEHARRPDDTAVLLLLGTILDDGGSPRGAELLRRYLELDPDSAVREAIEERLADRALQPDSAGELG